MLPTTVLIVVGICLSSSIAAQTTYENYTFTTFVGPQEAPGWYDGNGTAARFSSPFAVAVDNAGNLYVADNGNQTVRKITPGGAVTTLAGDAGIAGITNGTGYLARLASPAGVAVATNGNVYVANSGDHTIRKITAVGTVTTLAGSPTQWGTNDGAGAAARFYEPRGTRGGRKRKCLCRGLPQPHHPQSHPSRSGDYAGGQPDTGRHE